MNTETLSIAEGNRIIAEFMGATPCIVRVKSVGDEDGYKYAGDKLPLSEIEYHSSWDWIMPVAFKIKCYVVPEQDTAARQEALEDRCMRLWEEIAYCVACINIEMTWKAVVQFIKWYNNQTKQS